MRRAALAATLVGAALLLGLLAWQGIGAVASALRLAGWGVLGVAAFHLLPLLLDAAAIAVLLPRRGDRRVGFGAALCARWFGESVNSLMPAGQIGGPVLMIRYLSQCGMAGAEAGAIITVSTTLQTAAQLVFTLIGVAVCGAYVSGQMAWPLGVLCAVLAALLYLFYQAQRRGIFAFLVARLADLWPRRDWQGLARRAATLDRAVQGLYREGGCAALYSFLLSLLGWLVGIAEVWLALRLIGHPLGWSGALLLESLGQAVRGAAFAIPGALGVQEGGYVVLARIVALAVPAALALSLIKRAREIVLALPGLLAWHLHERRWRRQGAAQAEAPGAPLLAPNALETKRKTHS